ncbi:glycosyltransferase family 2 protein [Streptomyces sp. WMMC500]|uniref:glycosyltransferase family 2 protein n=1 Tax=Streptomyces sp. WMMC500 TaxID=3015154 RepID=UPI00248ACF2C|nr:glycosyltransferase family 2 protein [Streptomyces sp. WMMC500]WBB58979.1 glycosyltransferase family 2 protein [Streptomyces sp. WMMC500]
MSEHRNADYAAGYPASATDAAGRPGSAVAGGAAAPGDGAPAFPRHVVTAVLVSHDGERWLPDALAALTAQERPVQNVIAADTGSADGSARILTEALGAERVLHLARRTGFGTAAAEAARTAGVLTPDQLPYLRRPSGWDPVSRSWRDDAYDMPEFPHGEPVQWLWLLHDDCAAEPDALAALLRLADDMPSAAIIGPKLRGWYDRRQLLEAGVSIAHSGRRWTGIDRREQDQGQHDGTRDVLSVSTAGMLIRRDVFDQLGGFDARLPLMRDDVDLCWRAHKAGHRVVVQPDAVMRHAEAAARERRSIDCIGRAGQTGKGASPHRVDKAGAAYTLLVNCTAAALPYIAFRLVLGTLLRTLAYLVGKVPRQALDEVAGLGAVLLSPHRIAAARRRRGNLSGKAAVPPGDLKPLFPGRGATVRATVEQVLSNFSGRSEPELSGGGRHGGGVESGPGDEDADFLEVEQFARLKRVARKPGPVLFAVLLLVALIACRELIGGGALIGGALLPAPADAGDLWSSYADSWHPVGTGGTQDAPPYLAFLAGLGTVLFGSTDAALTLLLVCSVPLAGFTAYFASRPLVSSRLLRAWGSVAYAFLPAATGALAAGRIGTAVLAVLLPLLARAAVAASGLRGRASWRGAWAYALLLTVTAAFTPVVWPLAALLAGALAAWSVVRGQSPVGHVLRQLAVLVTPVVLLAPWSLDLLTAPSRFFTEAGLETTADVTPLGLLLASPGGPNAGGGVLLAGVVLAALAALLRSDRRLPVGAAWVVAAVAGLLAAAGAGDGWTGPQTLVYGLALLTAAVIGADGARQRVAEQSFGWRQPAAVLVAVACVVGPLALAAGWMWRGADGPLERGGADQVPAFVAEESRTADQPRTLVIGGSAGEVAYMLVRGAGARLGDAELAAAGGGNSRLSGTVSGLVAGSGADQSAELGEYAVRYVLVRNDAPRTFGRVLDATPGLTRLSQQDGGALWRVDVRVSRATVVAGEGAGQQAGTEPVPVPAGPVEVHTDLKAGPEGRVLRLADAASAGWQATLDGEPLEATTVDGWAQGFELPGSGGRLDVTYDTAVTHTAWTWARGAALLVVLVLALPGRRRDVDDDLPEAGAPAVPAQALEGDGRRARRLRAAAAAAEAEGAAGGAPAGADAPGAVPEPPPMPPAPPGAPGAPDEQPAWAGAPVPGTGQAEQGYGDTAAADPYAAPPQGYEWDGAGYGGQYGGTPYEAPYEPQYDAGAYEGEQQPGAPAVPQQGGQGYGEQDPYGTGSYPDPYYDGRTYGAGAERDGSDNA